MREEVQYALMGCFLVTSGCATELALHTYNGEVVLYPEVLPTSRPSILAFLDGNDRRCDRLMKPLRGLSSRPEAKLFGVLSYDDNAFLEQISTAREIVFPMMLDPQKKLVDRFGVSRYPTFVLVSPQGKEVARTYEIADVNGWYKPEMIYKAFGRKYRKRPEDLVEEGGGR